MADTKLVLHPADPFALLQDPGLLVECLHEAGLVGRSFPHEGELHYKPGPRFEELVTFRPRPGGTPAPSTVCHVAVVETTTEPMFLGASNLQPPSCSSCHARLADWQSQFAPWQRDKRHFLWRCPACGLRQPIQNLDWGRLAGVARYSVDIWKVAADQAEPSSELIQVLERHTSERWRYFYYRF
jgi:hypothetical protein